MLGNDHFYNRTIRKVVVAFGTIFKDIEVIRFAKNGSPQLKMLIPLSYGAKEKYLTKITSDPTLNKSVNTVVPRMSFNLDSLSYDSSRKQVTTLQNFSYRNGSLSSQYAPIPYNFEFSMSIYVRYTEDGTQILEQILPFFTPDFTVTVNFIGGMCQKYDMPIILNSVTSDIEYEGDMSTTRLIIWDLKFTAKGYIWPAVKTNIGNGLVGQYSANTGNYGSASINMYNNTSPNANTQLITVTSYIDPQNAEPSDDYGYTDVITEYY